MRTCARPKDTIVMGKKTDEERKAKKEDKERKKTSVKAINMTIRATNPDPRPSSQLLWKNGASQDDIWWMTERYHRYPALSIINISYYVKYRVNSQYIKNI